MWAARFFISPLWYGEFVGMVTDDPDEKIELKAFCCEIVNDRKKLQKELSGYKNLPVVSYVDQPEILDNYLSIKQDIGSIIESELERMMNTPALEGLIVKK